MLITQPRGTYHQGGFMAFGNDGLLYIGIGDGTDQYPNNRKLDETDLRGDVLRIDVDDVPSGEAYGIPQGPLGNPNAGNPRCVPTGNTLPCPEIFARGFRNPFRGAFDPLTSDLFVADVGFTQREEVSRVQLNGDYGWSDCEGFRELVGGGVCSIPGKIDPLIDYSHGNGNCAIIGGHVYRGASIAALQGRYVFADYHQQGVRRRLRSHDGRRLRGDPDSRWVRAGADHHLRPGPRRRTLSGRRLQHLQDGGQQRRWGIDGARDLERHRLLRKDPGR